MNISLYLLFVCEQKKWPVIFYIIHGYNEVLKKNHFNAAIFCNLIFSLIKIKFFVSWILFAWLGPFTFWGYM